ncbi:hypothetical protein K0B04_02890 [Patescibacteria group bacterium]|nr:hypothetical protein [Patescibacteria group bacterium]
MDITDVKDVQSARMFIATHPDEAEEIIGSGGCDILNLPTRIGRVSLEISRGRELTTTQRRQCVKWDYCSMRKERKCDTISSEFCTEFED